MAMRHSVDTIGYILTVWALMSLSADIMQQLVVWNSIVCHAKSYHDYHTSFRHGFPNQKREGQHPLQAQISGPQIAAELSVVVKISQI